MKCAFDEGAKCSALTCKQCDGCAFFKTPEQLAAGRKAADDHIDSLPKETRDHIRAKYPRGDF